MTTSARLARIHQLYYAAIAADNEYRDALIARYGVERAPCMGGYHLPYELADLRDAKIRADDDYLKACEVARRRYS